MGSDPGAWICLEPLQITMVESIWVKPLMAGLGFVDLRKKFKFPAFASGLF